MAIDPQKMCAIVWDWVNNKAVETRLGARIDQYNKYWDIYRGRHWEQESSEVRATYRYKVTKNEIRSAIDELVAYLRSSRPRHYHINIDPSIYHQRAINMFLVRASRYQYDQMLTNALLYSAIYGAAVLTLDVNMYARPWGYRGIMGERVLPMPVYRAEMPWQWIIDPVAVEDISEARYAIRFGMMSKYQAKQLAGRDVNGGDSYCCTDVYRQFLSRTTPSYAIRETQKPLETDDKILGVEVWFNNVPIGREEKPLIPEKKGWRYIKVVGDLFVSKDHWESTDWQGAAPLGDDVGIPATLLCLQPLPGYQYGQSMVAALWGRQQDLNFRRAKQREVEQMQGGVLHVAGAGAKVGVERLVNMRNTGIFDDPNGTMRLTHIRGERVSDGMYMHILQEENDFRRTAGLPPVLVGMNDTGTYSGAQVRALMTAAQSIVAWRASEMARAFSELGNKEWAALKQFWGPRRVLLDTGTEAAIIDGRVMNWPGWTAETLPEDIYNKFIQEEKMEVAQLFQMGLATPRQFYKRIGSLSDEEKEEALQYLEQRMVAAQSAKTAPASARAGAE